MILPNFLVIGAARSATTSLHYALRRHPQVSFPERKVPNFLCLRRAPGERRSWFMTSIKRLETKRGSLKWTDEEAIGDVSPTYLADPRACERIHGHIPEAKGSSQS